MTSERASRAYPHALLITPFGNRRGTRHEGTSTLRTYAFIDRMQPQCAAHIAATSPGDSPLAGMAELFIEMAPGNEVFRAADIALKAAGVRPALQIIEREFGLLEIHSEQQAEVLAAGQAVLDELGMTETDRIKPVIASTQFITNVHGYQAQLLNKWRKGALLMPGHSLFVMEVAPAAYVVAGRERGGEGRRHRRHRDPRRRPVRSPVPGRQRECSGHRPGRGGRCARIGRRDRGGPAMTVFGVDAVESVAGAAGTGELVVGARDIVTPLARDLARERGVTIVIAAGRPAKICPVASLAPETSSSPASSNGSTAPALVAATSVFRSPPSNGPLSPPAALKPPAPALYRRGAPLHPDVAPAALHGPHTSRPMHPGTTKPVGRVVVVGAGHVGMITAMKLAEANLIEEIVLVDIAEGLAAGIALDLTHSTALLGFDTRIRGVTGLAEAGVADYVVISAGRARRPGMSRTDLVAVNADIVGALARDAAAISPDTVLLVVTNPLDEMTHHAWRASGLPAERVIGMAGVLDSSRFQALTGLAAGSSPAAVTALALGSHGEEMVIPLSQARVGGTAISQALPQAKVTALVDRARNSGAEVVGLLKSGSAFFAPGASAARMVLAMATDSDEIVAATVLADGQYGIADGYVGLPARLGRNGLREIIEAAPGAGRAGGGADRGRPDRRAGGRSRTRDGRIMRAVVFAGLGAVEVASVPDPTVVEPTDALVKVHRAAICGTDLHTINHPDGLHRGAVLGHEFTGTVVAVGVGGAHPRIRKSRQSAPTSPRADTAGGAAAAITGNAANASSSAPVTPSVPRWPAPRPNSSGSRTPMWSCTPSPTGVSDEATLFFGDVLATGYAAVQRCDLVPGDTVAIIGGGPVGQMTSLAAQACSAGPVVLVEPVEERRVIAGAHGALVATVEEARPLVDALTDGRGADAVIEAVGGPRGLDTAFGLVRRRGTVVSVGVHQQPNWPLPVARAFADELTLRFAIGNAIRDRDRLSGLVVSGAIDPTIIVDHRVGLEEAPAAYEAMARRRTLKAVIEVS